MGATAGEESTVCWNVMRNDMKCNDRDDLSKHTLMMTVVELHQIIPGVMEKLEDGCDTRLVLPRACTKAAHPRLEMRLIKASVSLNRSPFGPNHYTRD